VYTECSTNSKFGALLNSWRTIFQLDHRVNPRGGTTSIKNISLPGLCTIFSEGPSQDKITVYSDQDPQNACTNFQHEIIAVLSGHFTQVFCPDPQLASFNSLKNLISICRDTPRDTRDCAASTDMFYFQGCTEVYGVSQKVCDQPPENTRSLLL
jgi:hypothetical protein